ncbi:MAG: DUF5711 family protein [Clostridiales bacterium]|nr:DUF5711 family protein [Clostridiales bacterium]
MAAQSGKKQKQKKNGAQIAAGVTRQLVIYVVSAVMLICAVLAIVYRDRLNLDALKRWVAYGSLSTDEDGQAERFSFSGGSDNAFASLDGGLLLCSSNTLQLLSRSGEEALSMEVSMKEPVISTAGDYAVVYDVGGSDLYVFHSAEQVFSYSTSGGYALLSARVNENGALVVVEQTSGYKATVTVYGSDYQPRIAINESTNFITDAVLSPDSRSVAVIEIYQDDSALGSDLVIYQVSDASVTSTTQLGEQLVLDLCWQDGRIWLEREYGVSVANSSGSILDTWADTSKYLERYSLDGDGYAVELMSKYKSGSMGELWVIDSSGQQKVSRSVSEEVLSVSAAGRYIAVLTTSSLVVYNSDLQEYASTVNTTARRVIMRSDGSAMMIGTDEAWLFVP